mgnify:CR=1 FL=1
MQVIVTTRVVVSLLEEESGGLFRKSKSYKIGEIDLLACNKLWILSNNYGLSLELAGFEKEETIAIQFHHRNNQVKGFDKEQTVQFLREEFLKNKENYIGKIAELRFFEFPNLHFLWGLNA